MNVLSFRSKRFSFRQNQSNELLKIQQASVEREHELAEDFRLKISQIKQEFQQIKRLGDERLVRSENDHRTEIERIQIEHRDEIERIQTNLQKTFAIEHEAQTKFYEEKLTKIRLENERQTKLYEEKLEEIRRGNDGQSEFYEEKLEKLRDENENQKKFYEEQLTQVRLEHERFLLAERDERLVAEQRKFDDEIERLRNELINEKELCQTKNDEIERLSNELAEIHSKFHNKSNEFSKLNEQVRRLCLMENRTNFPCSAEKRTSRTKRRSSNA